MKGLFLIVMLILPSITLAIEQVVENVVNIYTWSRYLPEKVIAAFEQETGIHVNHSTYINNEVLYTKLKTHPNSGYDVIAPSAYFVQRMAKQGLIQPIDKSKIFNLENIHHIFLNQTHDPNNEYSIPYLWTATGIVVNRKYHPPGSIQYWKDLWDKRYQDQLLVLDDTRELFSVALMVLGHSIDSTNAAPIEEAYKKLRALMPNIKLFNTDIQRSIYLDEDVTVGMGWNGDIYLAKLENPSLDFFYPKEGFVLALDCLAIPKNAPHVQNAYRFIEFVLRPEIAKQISLEGGFSTANAAAVKLLPDRIRNSEILYPDDSIMARAKFPSDIGQTATVYEKYFEALKLSP